MKALVAGSIFFVWVVRYQNIVKEFKDYGLPSWLRDLVGIFKLSFVLMLFIDDLIINLLGASAISILMLAAMATHLRVCNPFYKMAPSISLMIISSVIFLSTYMSIT
jgi:hypothetical protein